MAEENEGVFVEEEEDNSSEDQQEENKYQTMIEAQIINYMLDNGSFDFFKKNGLNLEYFPGYEDEVKFILEHYNKYKVVPDVSTFLDKFPEFDLFEVNEAEAAMLEAIKEARGYALLAPSLKEIDEIARKDSIEAAKAMRDKADSILKEVNVLRFSQGYDLFKLAEDRYKLYLERLALKGQLGCIWNIPKFDETIGGVMETDFLALQGRPGEGKSWIMEYLILQPWLVQKKPIILFSLENPKHVVGYRADTLLRHFSNFGLMSGRDILGWDNNHPSLNQEDYAKWVQEAKYFDVPFLVYDNEDSATGAYTIEDIYDIAEANDSALIAIDQLSLIAPSGRFKTIREHYIHVTRSIRQNTNRLKKPTYLNCQAGRESSKMQMKNKEAAPELHQIAESDSVGQDATKAISIRNLDGILKLSLKKNTLGRSNIDALLRWEIDTGVLEPLALEDDTMAPNPGSIF